MSQVTLAQGVGASGAMPRVLRVSTELDQTGGLLVTVADSGTGINSEVLKRCLIQCSLRSLAAWDWGSQSAARSSKVMAVDCGQRQTRAEALFCNLVSHYQRAGPRKTTLYDRSSVCWQQKLSATNRRAQHGDSTPSQGVTPLRLSDDDTKASSRFESVRTQFLWRSCTSMGADRGVAQLILPLEGGDRFQV